MIMLQRSVSRTDALWPRASMASTSREVEYSELLRERIATWRPPSAGWPRREVRRSFGRGAMGPARYYTELLTPPARPQLLCAPHVRSAAPRRDPDAPRGVPAGRPRGGPADAHGADDAGRAPHAAQGPQVPPPVHGGPGLRQGHDDRQGAP